MKSKDKTTAKGNAKVIEELPAKPRGRVTRNPTNPMQSAPIEFDNKAEDEEIAEAPTHAATAPSDDQPIRELISTAEFSTCTLIR
jgi:hypothetical protein